MERRTASKLASRLALLGMALTLGACGGRPISVETQSSVDTPTVSSLFQRVPALAPTLVPAAEQPTLQPVPVRPASDQVQLIEQVLFDEALHSDWTVEYSDGMRYSLDVPAYVQSGGVAIEATPLYPASKLLFAVRADTPVAYPREKVLGLSFWLSGGANFIETDALLVSILGSNEFSYYIKGDTSVAPAVDASGEDITFSSTRLYYLGINRPIPPDTWVEVFVPLDDLIYDPDYSYVTGFSIKSDAAFFDTFYVDNVRLILLP